MTVWTDPTDKTTNWRTEYTEGRHTYGAEYGTLSRIRYGDNVRYGGIANQSEISTSWS